MNRPRPGVAVRLATVGPAGHFSIAPGTAGSAVGVAIVAILQRLPLQHLAYWEGAVAIAVFAVGVWSAGQAEKFYGMTDPGPVVIDEVAGQMAVFLFNPPASWLALGVGFIFFRIFDVLKPFPARRAERLPRGWGIMTDDLVAGAYGAAALLLLGSAIR